MTETTDLAKKLAPEHLPTTAEMKAQLENVSTGPKKLEPNPRDQVEYTFQFSHKDARGRMWEGEFIHKIPSLAQRDLIDMLQARKKGNMPVESFSAMAAERHLYLAHLEVCLTKRPKWANNLDDLLDPAIVEKLYQEAASHEAHFLGWLPYPSSGTEERQDGDSQST